MAFMYLLPDLNQIWAYTDNETAGGTGPDSCPET